MKDFLKAHGYRLKLTGANDYETYFKRHSKDKFIHLMLWHDGEMDIALFVYDTELEDWDTPQRIVTENQEVAQAFIKENDV